MTTSIIIKGLTQNNLKNISLELPKNKIIVFTGVSGSGKSSLIRDVFAKQYEDQVVLVDQSAITATGRSTACTYLGFFDNIRKLFGEVTGKDAKKKSCLNINTNEKHLRPKKNSVL